MTDPQFNQLLLTLNNLGKVLANNHYTITGADDWPLLQYIGGGAISIIMVLLIWILKEVRGTFRRHEKENKETLSNHEKENKQDNIRLWRALDDCQFECCKSLDRRKNDRRRDHWEDERPT